MNFYKRYLGEYARDTAHLTLMEHGAYTAMLDTYYATEKSLPADKGSLYRIAKAFNAAERKAVDKIADEFFPVNGDSTRHNKRADEELNGYRTQADTNRRIAVEREARRRQHEKSTKRATDGSTNDQPKPEARSKIKTPIPENFGISDRVAAWAASKGISNLEAHMEFFKNQCAAKGYRNVDWDRAFMNAVTADWAKIGTGGAEPKKLAAG